MLVGLGAVGGLVIEGNLKRAGRYFGVHSKRTFFFSLNGILSEAAVLPNQMQTSTWG